MVTAGRIVRETRGGFLVEVTLDEADKERVKRSYLPEVNIEFVDGRHITPLQRRKIYAILGHIAAWQGDLPETTKELMKWHFLAERGRLADKRFSLADCTLDEAKAFINWLVEFCVVWNVPTGRDPLAELAEDIPRYIWACLMHKKCAICGDPAQLHHVDAVGRRSRREICHVGMRVLPLCGRHHAEAHAKTENDFLTEYMLKPIPLAADVGRVYRLTKRNMGLI